MIRKVIKIDKEKCNGCGLCVSACHEGAIGIIDGKATLLRDDYCDGLGDCLPNCPASAISFEEREALPYSIEEVKKNIQQKETEKLPCGCPGTNAKVLKREKINSEIEVPKRAISSQLEQWPVQIKLVSVNAPYFEKANILISADCAAYAYGNFHNEFMKNKVTLIGCPKLDGVDYSEKLTAILKNNNVKSVTVVRMEVPCCGGIENAVKIALKNSGKMIPWQVVTISTDGQILDV
ncbi:MAG: 4Fe-4S binding protein [Oscillospiraceae bacterium]|nr:4Fe-4S binding protein [Oscillospiraceae bacterium]